MMKHLLFTYHVYASGYIIIIKLYAQINNHKLIIKVIHSYAGGIAKRNFDVYCDHNDIL